MERFPKHNEVTSEQEGEQPESPRGEFLGNFVAGKDVYNFRQDTDIPQDELIFDKPQGVDADENGAQGLVGVYRKNKSGEAENTQA